MNSIIKKRDRLVDCHVCLTCTKIRAPGPRSFCNPGTLQDVGLLVRDEDDEELLERLVDIADMVCLDGGVLLSCAGQLGE